MNTLIGIGVIIGTAAVVFTLAYLVANKALKNKYCLNDEQKRLVAVSLYVARNSEEIETDFDESQDEINAILVQLGYSVREINEFWQTAPDNIDINE